MPCPWATPAVGAVAHTLRRLLPMQMTLALYVGNAIKDLVCSPRPLGVPYGKQRLRLLGAQGEEAELNAKVRAGPWNLGPGSARCLPHLAARPFAHSKSREGL